MQHGHPITRRQFIGACIGGAAIVASAGVAWEDNHLIVREETIASPNLPTAFDGLRILHLSDYHNKTFPFDNPLPGLISQLEPDLIAITGDLVDRNRTNLELGYALVEQCVATAPTYYVPGNHENGVRDRVGVYTHIGDLGAHVLIFRQVEFSRGDATMRIAGVPDPVAPGHWSKGVAGFGRAATDDERFCMLLSHRPERFDEYCDAGYDLVLAGHAHGGQVCLPGGQAILAPHQGFFPRYTDGVHRNGDTAMVVSRGIGVSSFPIRINCPPEVVLITLRSEA